MRKEFIQALGLTDSLEGERKRFVQRINQTLFNYFETTQSHGFGLLFDFICVELGVNAHDIKAQYHGEYGPEVLTSDRRNHAEYKPPLRILTGDDFIKTLEVVVYLFQYERASSASRISGYIDAAFAKATLDVGVEWKDGLFYKKGVEALDKALLEDGLDFLQNYPNERKLFADALRDFLMKDYSDVLRKCHIVIEGLIKQMLGNDKTVDANREAFISRLQLGEQWKHIVKYYLEYAHKAARHGSATPITVIPIEAEAFLYMTGLIVRLIVQSIHQA